MLASSHRARHGGPQLLAIVDDYNTLAGLWTADLVLDETSGEVVELLASQHPPLLGAKLSSAMLALAAAPETRAVALRLLAQGAQPDPAPLLSGEEPRWTVLVRSKECTDLVAALLEREIAWLRAENHALKQQPRL